MARPVRTPMNEVSGADDEFQRHVERGAELLSRGDASGARESLTRAAELRPGDLKALGLLGQALYRLGKFDDAAALFGKLVEQNPAEPGAQVNLGLANLRARRYVEAISHLEKALDLNPDHRKAMGYLGLAWLEHGNVARAREWFSRGGSDHMVARCDELLAAARRSAATPSDPQWTVAPVDAVKVPESAKAPEPVKAPEPPKVPEVAKVSEAVKVPEVAKVAVPEEPVPAERGLPPEDEAEITSAMRVLGSDRSAAKGEPAPASAWDDVAPSKSAAGWKLAPITVIGPPARCTEPGPAPFPPSQRDTDPAWAKQSGAGVARPPAPPVVEVRTEAAAPTAVTPTPPAEAAETAAEPHSGFDVDETEPITIEPVPAADMAAAGEPHRPEPVTLEEMAANGIPATDADAKTFTADRGILRVSVRGEVLTRVRRLVATRGEVEMAAETRRYRGRGTDKLFGDGRDAMHRVRGEGALLLRTSGGRYTVVELAGSAGFFREDAVFAMESSIEFDNARLTTRAGPDVDLVQLRGDGTFVLVTEGEVVSVDVSESPLRVAATALIGWTGALTPRLTTLAEGGPHDARAVELTGEGRVLLDSGSADG